MNGLLTGFAIVAIVVLIPLPEGAVNSNGGT